MTHKPSPHPKKPRPRKNTKRTGEFSEVEASCGRDPERSEGGSLQPKSRAQRGTSTSPCSPLHKKSARKNTKRTGEFSEAAFLTKATGLGFRVAKPWGDSERYDFIVARPTGGCSEFFWRVQVKCTEIIRARAYEVRAAYTIGKGRAIYTPHDIDFLVAHIVPRDIWYVVPVEACMRSPMLRFYPDGAKCARFEPYREAWHLLHRPKPSRRRI